VALARKGEIENVALESTRTIEIDELVKLISHRIDFGSDEWRHQCCRTRH